MKHYLRLIDGTSIEAFPKAEQPEHIEADNLALDTKGEYLQVCRHLKSEPAQPSATVHEQIMFFLRYAHRLIAQSDTILSDSRMFLAPLPIRNGLAYTGTSGLRNPTLGIYIEWWRNYERAWIKDKFGELHPIYYIAGSPLSGRNSCSYISADGNSRPVSVDSFNKVWGSFMEVNKRYTEAKQLYESYTLEEVIAKLFGKPEENN